MRQEIMSQETFSEGRDTLPTNVKPVHYNLRLAPDLETFEFEGEVTIEYALNSHCTDQN